MPLFDMLSSSGARIKGGGCRRRFGVCVGQTTSKHYRRQEKYCKNFMVAILVGADPPHTRKEFRLEPTTEKDPSTRNHVTRPIGEHTKAEMQAGRIYVNTGSWSEMFLNRFLQNRFQMSFPRVRNLIQVLLCGPFPSQCAFASRPRPQISMLGVRF